MKGYRAKMRRKAHEIRLTRYTLDWITETTNELIEARDLPPLGGMKAEQNVSSAAMADTGE